MYELHIRNVMLYSCQVAKIKKHFFSANRITPYHDFGFVALDITDCKEEDSGVYMCRGWNKVGEAFTTASLRVHRKY